MKCSLSSRGLSGSTRALFIGAGLGGMLALVPPAEARYQGSVDAVPGRLIVRFKAGSPASKQDQILRSVGSTRLAEIPQIGAQLIAVPVGVEGAGYADALRTWAEVEGVEPNRLVPQAEFHPNDPYYAYQQMDEQVRLPQAWSLTTGSAGVTIAILDGGVDASHPDLAPNMVAGWNFHTDSPDTPDLNGHGTKAAGTAAAVGNNGMGVAGISWPSKIMPIGTSSASGMGDVFAIANGLVWAADHGARVANVGYQLGDTTNSVVSSAAQYFQSRGGLVASAAGNDGQYLEVPNDPYILTVGAITRTNTVTSWSNTGTNIDLSAPQESFSTIAGGGYGLALGTSYSTSFVTGVAALMLSVNPNLTGAELRDLLIDSADDLGPNGWDPGYGWGRLNAEQAVAMALGDSGGGGGGSSDNQAPSAEITSPSDQASIGTNTTIRVSASDNVGVTKVEFFVDGVLVGTDTRRPYSYRWRTRNVDEGPHTISAKAHDAAGNVATSLTITVFR